MSTEVNEFYDGSTILQPLFHSTGLPIDQVNFLVCQLVALSLGFPYRWLLGPHRASPTSRHVVQILIGVPLAYFCFGRQIIHLVAQSVICLVLMRVLYPGVMEKSVLFFAMAYLCVCHLNRMMYDYGGYTLDITGPLMLNTQRLSSLAFNLRDGKERDETKLTSSMKRLLIREPPSLLESASYIFCFHGLMCGPFCFYKDYIAFIEGTNYSKHPQTTTVPPPNTVSNNDNHKLGPPPAPGMALIKKLLTAVVFGITTVSVIPRLPSTLLTGPEFQNHSFVYRNFLIALLTSVQRQKYYFAWKLGEAINVSSGLGFNGYSEKGVARWDLIDNADILKIEFATSIKQLLDNWNKSTTNWLRYVVYERWPSTMAVFIFSAFWHGFYAGYYLTFLTAGMFLNTSRLLRRHIRPYFQSSARWAHFYDVLTFLVTKVTMPYIGFPFMILALQPSFEIYRHLYFWQHMVVFFLFLFLTLKPHLSKPKAQ